MHINECGGGYSGARQQTIPDYFDIEARNCNSAPFAKNEETVQSLKLMFPDIPANRIEDVLVSTKSWEEAVDILVTNHPESGSAVIQSFVDGNLDTINTKVVKIKREDIWRDAVRFYKISMAKKSNLFQKLAVGFEGEEGIDVGALTVEYFRKLFEIFRRVKSETFLIPKRSGGNLTLFKILGITIGNSLLQGQPPFPYLHPWCYAMITQKSEEEIVGLISKEKCTELIPLNAGTADVISFLNVLSRTKSEKDIDDLFECTEGQAFEQVVNATQWPIDKKITTNNIGALKAMIIWDEVICKREKQLNAITDGLAYVEFLLL